MKLQSLKPFEQIPYFTISGFKQTLGVEEAEAQRVREMLSRWIQAGHLLQLKRGVYMTRRFAELHRGDPAFAPAVSAILLPQSYLSLEYVLQRSGVLTEVTYPITGVTAKHTRTIANSLGAFAYRHVKLSLYTGFTQENYLGLLFNQASVAKALFDYFYLRPLPRAARRRYLNLAEELRLNIEDFSDEAKQEFGLYVEISRSPKMDFLLGNLQRTVWQH